MIFHIGGRDAWQTRALGLAAVLLFSACEKPAAAPEPPPLPAAKPAPEPEVLDVDARFAEALMGHRAENYFADLDEIKRRNVLRVITRNNSTSYFLYRGVEAGYHYELAKLLADDLGVRLEVVVPKANRDVIPWLLEGRGDIVMSGLKADAPRTDRATLSPPYLESPLVVVTRKNRVPALTGLADMAHATVTVRASSSAMKRMRDLASANPKLTFNIRAGLETDEPEDLMDRVGSSEIDAVVLEKRIVDVELFHRDDLTIAFELPGPPLQAVLATRNEAPALGAAAAAFIKKNHRGMLFNMIYNRFHKNTKRAANAQDEEYRGDKKGSLSPWDEAFKKFAHKAGMDWRLLAAQAFQESGFDENAKSQFGAQGLMQIMPATAKELGVTRPFDPIDSIRGGAKYMAQLIKRYDKDGIKLKNRVRLALAAYNVGFGHVEDARKLAKVEGLDPNRWFGHVEKTLLKLSKPRYYRKAKYGYCRGEEPVGYVSKIQSRYDNYVMLTDPNAGKPEESMPDTETGANKATAPAQPDDAGPSAPKPGKE